MKFSAFRIPGEDFPLLNTRIVFRLPSNSLFYLVICSMMLLVGCVQNNVNPDSQVNDSEAQSELARAAEPYKGITIRGISEETPPSIYIQEVLIPEFEAETGISVDLQLAPYTDVYEHSIAAMQTGSSEYDFVYVEQDYFYEFLDKAYLTNLDQMLEENPNLHVSDFNPIDFTSFLQEFQDPESGDLYAMPFEAFIKTYMYRSDLFSDESIQAEFFEQYGYPLSPAITLEQYMDITVFFTEYGRKNNLDLWGTVVQADISHPAAFLEFVDSIAPLFGIYSWGINLETYSAMEARGGQLDSPEAVAAFEYYLRLVDNAPPEATSSTWDGATESFAEGRAVQGLIYGDQAMWLNTDKERSAVVGKVSVALPPVDPSVNAEENYIGYYDGGAFGIPLGSRQKEATLLWLQFLSRSSIQADWAVNSGRIVHLSTFKDPEVQQRDRDIGGYFSIMENYADMFAAAPPFPFYREVLNVAYIPFNRAIAGELTAEEALSEAAQAIDAELKQLGYSTP